MSGIKNNLGLMNKVVIDCSNANRHSMGTRIFLNDVEIYGVTGITFNASTDSAPTCTFTIIADVECISRREGEK